MSNRRKPKRRLKNSVKKALIVALIIFIAVIAVIVITSLTKKKEPVQPDIYSEIPEEYVEPTYVHADIAITDEDPTPSYNTDFLIKVNTALNVTVVYSKDNEGNLTPLRAIPCSTAREGYETPLGDFWLCEWIIKPSNEWCYMADGTQGLYAYRITNGEIYDIMFHSVPYFETDHGTLEWEEYNKLGSVASMGCMRMCCADVRWLGETCGNNTDIEIYSDPNEQLPLEVPAPIRIPGEVEEIRGWDPTDPASNNPWHNYTLKMEVPNSVEITSGDDANAVVLSNTKITDMYGHDLSHYAEVIGTCDTSTAGLYPVTVKAVIGPVTATKDVYIVVKDSEK